MVGGRKVLNFCANNYLGLSSHPNVIEAAHRAIDSRGYGMSSVRFICGTQDIHRELERKLAAFLGTEDRSCMPRLLMPTAACSNLYSASRMRSSRTS